LEHLGAPPIRPTEEAPQQRGRVEVGAGQQPQFAEHLRSHLLGFVDQQHGLDAGGGQMGTPPLAEGFEAAIAIRGAEFHREDLAQFAIEVGRLGLRPLQHAEHYVPQGPQAFGDDPQGHRLAGPRLAGDHREAALLDQLLDAPGEVLDPGSHQQRVAGQFG